MGSDGVVATKQSVHGAHADLVDADHLPAQQIDESPEDALGAPRHDGVDVE